VRHTAGECTQNSECKSFLESTLNQVKDINWLRAYWN